MGFVGIDLAEVDELVGSLWQVQARTDEFEGDLARAVNLVGEGAGIGAELRTIGEDCFQAGTRVRLEADRLRNFRLPVGRFGPTHYVPSAVRGGVARAGGWIAFGGGQLRGGRPVHEADAPLVGLLIDAGLAPEEAVELAASFANRLDWVDLNDIEVDLTDADAFGPFSLAIMAAAFPDLVAANKLVRAQVFGPTGRPVRGQGPRQPGPPASQDLLSESDLIRIAAHPDLVGEHAAIAALLLDDRAFLAALDGAAKRTGDILGGQAIHGLDHVFSIDDVSMLSQQRLLALGLGPFSGRIDAIGGGIDGIRSKLDFTTFADDIRSTHPQVANLADQVADMGLFDQGGWDKVADRASGVGLMLAALAVAVAVVGTGGLALPGAIALATAVAGGTEFVAGLKTKDVGHAVGGGLGAVGGGATVVRSLIGLRAGLVGGAAGFGDATLGIVDDTVKFNHALKTSHELPTMSRSEVEFAAARFELSPDEMADTFGSGVRAAVGSADKLAHRLEAHVVATTDTRFVPDDWAVDQLGGLTRAIRLAEAVDTVIENGVAPVAGLLAASAATTGQGRRHDDDGDAPAPTRNPTPAPTPPAGPAPTAERSTDAHSGPASVSSSPAPQRTPTPLPAAG